MAGPAARRADAGAAEETKPEGRFAHQFRAGLAGVTFAWTLIACSALGIWLMFSRLLFDTAGTLADSDHLTGALVLTTAVIAFAEVARPLRLLNLALGLWIALSPFVVSGAATKAGTLNDLAVGLLIASLSLPRGKRSEHRYGGWDRLMV